MAKFTIEIDLDDTQDSWDALYRNIEACSESPNPEEKELTAPTTGHVTYDLLLDPERSLTEVGGFLAVLAGRDDDPTRVI